MFIFFLFFLITIFIFFIFIFYALFALYTIINWERTPFVPTSFKKNKRDFEEVLKFLETIELPNKKMIDIGSGDGRIVIEFAKRGYQAYGVEINPVLVWISKLKAKINKIKNAFFLCSDGLKINFKDFGIVYLYQLPSFNEKLVEKLESELPQNSIIISLSFPMPETQKIKLIQKIGNFLIYKYSG